MLYTLAWFLVLALLAAWSLGVWALHSVTAWSLTGIGLLVTQSQQIDRLPVPGWVGIWLPADLILAFKTTAASVLPWVESSLAALPSLAGWLAPVAWIVWAVGFVILAVGAVALHALISVIRKAAVQ